MRRRTCEPQITRMSRIGERRVPGETPLRFDTTAKQIAQTRSRASQGVVLTLEIWASNDGLLLHPTPAHLQMFILAYMGFGAM